MGNCFSTNNTNDTIALHNLVDRPNEQEAPMTAETIHQALARAATTLHSKKRNIIIIVVGRAVNTLLLNTRNSTGDVDFFYHTKTKHEDVTRVLVAAHSVATELRLGDQWLNNHTALFIEEGTIQRLYNESITQNEIVFTAPGLTLYAAPWRYAIAAKLDSLSKLGTKPCDMSDAVGYLERLVANNGGNAVEKSEIKAWAQEFKYTMPTDSLMNLLGAEYQKKTKKNGVSI